jgi:signal transduction histidine kinase
MYYTNHSVSHVFISNNFKFSELTNTDNPKFWAMVSLIFYFTIPSLRPAAFQRILIGSSISQVKKAFTISAFLLTFVMLTTCWIAFLALSMNDNLRPDQLLGFIIDKYSYSGFKGLITIGIIAMAMSTADSILNATAVLFSNDILAPLNIGVNRQLLISKLFSVGLGFCAIIFAFYGKDLLSIILLANSFYMPIVTVPLLLAILGFRSTKKSVLCAMSAGFMTVIILKNFAVGDPIFCGMLANVIFLFGFHYLFKQAGGWVGIKDYSYLESSKKEKSRMISALVRNIRAFSFIEFCKERAPKDELNYMWLGIYFIIYGFSTMYSTRLELVGDQSRVIVVVYQIMMVTGVLMAMYPIWPPRIKHEIIVQIAWYIVIFYMLIVFAVFFVMVNKFGQLQFALFVLNILIATILTGWRLGIGMSIVGFYFGLELYKYYAGINEIDFTVGSPEFVSIYVVILAGAVLLMFFKPKEEYQELTEEKNEHLNGRINMYKDQVREAEALKGRFIRNITHEYHAPMTGISSMAQVLVQDYDKLNDEQRKIAAKTILDSSLRLEVFDANISSLSKLNKPSYELKLVPTDFSVLVEDRVTLCRKLYENEEERIINRQAARETSGRKWQLDIEEGIVLNIDKYYMSQALDNLIINSINYAKSGTIGINLKRDKDKEAIVFSISDEGIGIPPEELEEVFEEFTVSSRTESFAGGRGVGLAVCKKVIEVHGGAIKAESKKMGTRISFTLPKIIKNR